MSYYFWCSEIMSLFPKKCHNIPIKSSCDINYEIFVKIKPSLLGKFLFIYLVIFILKHLFVVEHVPDVPKMVDFLIRFKIGPIKIALFCHDEIWFCYSEFLFETSHTCTCAYFGLKCGHTRKSWIYFWNWIQKMMTSSIRTFRNHSGNVFIKY